MRRGSGERGRVAGPLYDATLASAVCIVPIGLVIGDLDFTPSAEATAWLIVLALSSQVVGWLLITVLAGPAAHGEHVGAADLQPLLAVLFAALLVDERPSPLQLVGAAAILSGPPDRLGRSAAAPAARDRARALVALPAQSASDRARRLGRHGEGRAVHFSCAECGYSTGRWLGRCPGCGASALSPRRRLRPRTGMPRRSRCCASPTSRSRTRSGSRRVSQSSTACSAAASSPLRSSSSAVSREWGSRRSC